MSEYVYIYDERLGAYWKSPGMGYTSHREEAFPWSRTTAEEAIGGDRDLVIQEIEPEKVLT